MTPTQENLQILFYLAENPEKIAAYSYRPNKQQQPWIHLQARKFRQEKIRERKRGEAIQENDFTNTRPVIYRDVKVK
ncbi:hypothetical protein ACWJJH_04345 [Endozoicomonadaceae bacterium StTr2]